MAAYLPMCTVMVHECRLSVRILPPSPPQRCVDPSVKPSSITHYAKRHDFPELVANSTSDQETGMANFHNGGPTRSLTISPSVSCCSCEGITMEGVGCVLAGVFGSGTGMTSFSTNIAAIAATKVRPSLKPDCIRNYMTRLVELLPT